MTTSHPKQRINTIAGHLKQTTVVIAALCLIASSYVYVHAGGWVWEATILSDFPAMRLLITPNVHRVALHLDRQELPETHFTLATTPRALREFWSFDETDSQDELVKCDTPASPGQAPGRPQHIVCALSETALRITFPQPSTPSLKPGSEESARNKKKRHQEFWLIPHQEIKKALGLHTVAAVRWSRVDFQTHDGENFSVTSEACSADDLDERAEVPCKFVLDMLGRPQLTLARDPQPHIILFSKAATLKFIPVVVVLLVAVCCLVLVFNGFLLLYWLRGKGITPPPKGSIIVDAESIWAGVRRLLYYLEILGPAVGFTMTVLGLMIAFDREAFGSQNKALFGAAISAALSVTFCGLVLRLLSFTADRLIEHLSHWYADAAGVIYGEDSQVNTSEPLAHLESASKPSAAAAAPQKASMLGEGRD